MEPIRRAVIDVGTNSVKLLVADVLAREVQPVWERSHQTRLGQGFYESRRLQSGPVAKTAEAVAEFAEKAREERARSLRVIATSAVRDAVNAEELSAAIRAACGQVMEVISGEQEAAWAFLGVTTDPALSSLPLWLVEVGGGSTQFILGQGDHIDFRSSFPLGTVRMLERLPHSDPPRVEELSQCREMVRTFLEAEVRARLKGASGLDAGAKQSVLVGTGGTSSILGCLEAGLTRFERERLEATRLSRKSLTGWAERVWSLPLNERRQLPGLPPSRADVLLNGVVVYEQVMAAFAFDELRISTRGVRFGALLSASTP